MKNKKYYKNLDIIRVISCIAVFLYHLNILKGGYLAVCIFFVLTGYLSFISSFNKEKFSIKNYYLDKLKHIYLPFIIVVFISVFVISLIPLINWINLKPETTSSIFGYNNFWQLNASLDYFARHVDSPFMHFWYISILLQFELIFPLLFMGIKKFNEKFNKSILLIFLILLSLIGTSYFVYSSFNQNIMFVYYNTFTRVFSILFGLTIGYINCYYKKVISNKIMNSKLKNIIFYLYIVILIIIMFLMIDSTSKVFFIGMILTSIMSLILIEYGTIEDNNIIIFDKIIKSISSISYEIYLIQYPVIFLFQELSLNYKYMFLLVIGITVLLSYILHFVLNFKKDSNKVNFFMLKVSALTIILLFSIFGLCKYIVSKDYTDELKELESQLIINQSLMKERQEEYALKLKEEDDNYNLILENLENDEASLQEYVSNLHIIGIGDSVMLGAIKYLYRVFPRGYFDAKTSRTDWEADGILQKLKNKGMLGEPILFGLGTNGQCGSKCRNKISNTVGDKKMFWITTTNRKMSFINNELKELSKNKENVYIIDWENESRGHNEYFLADKIHLNSTGKDAYSKFIYNEIYNAYLNEIKNKKEKMIEEHNEKLKSKIVFYGNDLLLNSFELLNDSFINSKFEIDNYDYEKLHSNLKNNLNINSLASNYVFIFDSSFKITEEEYKNLIDLLDGKNVYVLFINSRYNLKYKNTKVISIDKELMSNKNYLLVDKVHLSIEGNKYLTERLIEEIN